MVQSQNSSSKLISLFLYVYAKNFQDCYRPIKHTSVQNIINLATTIFTGGQIMSFLCLLTSIHKKMRVFLNCFYLNIIKGRLAEIYY